ncbi:MAG: hypothetical protein R3B82_15395 [Sandaracinaceae bacterium]
MTEALSRVVARDAVRANEDLPAHAFVALAVAFPVALWAAHHGLGHEGDIAFFADWYRAFRDGPGFYRDGPGLNYPILGVLVVCGPAWLVERVTLLDDAGLRFVLKATLVALEALQALAAAGLAGALGARRPRGIGLGLALLPSTLTGGAWFGQIDPATTALLLASAWGLVVFHRRGELRAFALGLLALAAALLTKQLAWLSAPALVGLAGIGLLRHRSGRALALAAATPLLLFAADPLLVLPPGYATHLGWVAFGGGSDHGALAVASGASVWSLFVRGGTLASDVEVAGVSSAVIGGLVFAAVQLAALARAWKHRGRAITWVWLAGIAQLAMATLLTGVHERYFVHAIALLYVVSFASADRLRRMATLTVAAAAGLFVLVTITPPLDDTVLGRPEPLALLGLGWLALECALGPPSRRIVG